MVRIRLEIEENTLLVVLWLGLAKIEKNTLLGKALVRVRAKIEKNTLFGKNNTLVEALVRARISW